MHPLETRSDRPARTLTASPAKAWVSIERQPSVLILIPGGEWITEEVAGLYASLHDLDVKGAEEVAIDARQVRRLDTAGAWLLLRIAHELEQSSHPVRFFRVPPAYEPLFDTLRAGSFGEEVAPPVYHSLSRYLETVGRDTLDHLAQGWRLLGFLGRVTIETFEAFVRPDREIPWPAFVNQIAETGVTALPIVGLLSFMIGVVLAYQGAEQLARFGAQIYTVNLVGIGVTREIGGLMTAIIVAGRSGSAFTAQIGTMKLNQEIDAMETIGLNPIEILVLPRLLGMLVALPLLTFYANLMGLVGGAVMCYVDLDITIPAFLRQLNDALNAGGWSFWLGLIKAPFFAFLIALVGCFEGFRVAGDAGSVGRLTTRSVVESIFLVITFDAGFSVLFSILNV